MTETTKNDKKMRQIRPVPYVLNLIYPPACGICGKLDDGFLCKKCYKVLESEAEFGIEHYTDEDKIFDQHLYIFKYEGIIRRIILKYKFQDQAYLYKTFVNFLLKNKKFFEILKSYDTIIPVPISKKREKERGYNQSLLLAKEIANNTGLDLINNCLYKTKNIMEQSKLNKEERIYNIKGAYKLKNGQKLENKRVILLDDIYTTGSTVSECCKILKEAKPQRLCVFTIAKD